jgi:hypothetical protein
MAFKYKKDKVAYEHKWYLENKKRVIAGAMDRHKVIIRRNKDYANKIKLERGCADCGYNTDSDALDFDHLRDKVERISRMLQTSRSIASLDAEIAKCDVVCANCHRIRTKRRRAA